MSELTNREQFFPPVLKQLGTDTTFQACCYLGFLNLVKFLWKSGLYTEGLWEACSGGHLEIVQTLLNWGLVPDIRTFNQAASEGHLEILHLLSTYPLSYNRLVEFAAQRNQLSIIYYVINSKILMPDPFSMGYALMLACSEGHLEALKLMVKHGADIHFHHENCLFSACGTGQSQIVEYFLENGADLHINQDFALYCALRDGHSDTVDLLLDWGADLEKSQSHK